MPKIITATLIIIFAFLLYFVVSPMSVKFSGDVRDIQGNPVNVSDANVKVILRDESGNVTDTQNFSNISIVNGKFDFKNSLPISKGFNGINMNVCIGNNTLGIDEKSNTGEAGVCGEGFMSLNCFGNLVSGSLVDRLYTNLKIIRNDNNINLACGALDYSAFDRMGIINGQIKVDGKVLSQSELSKLLSKLVKEPTFTIDGNKLTVNGNSYYLNSSDLSNEKLTELINKTTKEYLDNYNSQNVLSYFNNQLCIGDNCVSINTTGNNLTFSGGLTQNGNTVSINNGAITSNMIQNNSITPAQLANCASSNQILLFNGSTWVCDSLSSFDSDRYHTSIVNTPLSGGSTKENKIDITSSNGAPPLSVVVPDSDNQQLVYNPSTQTLGITGSNTNVVLSGIPIGNADVTSASITSATISSGALIRTLTLNRSDGSTVTVALPDNDTLYSAGVGLSLAGTTFNNTGLLTLMSGDGVILVDNTSPQNPKVSMKLCPNGEFYLSNGTSWTCAPSSLLYSFNIQDAGTGISNITNGENVTFKATDGLTAVVSPTGDVSYGILDNSVLGTKIADASLPKEKLAACSGAGEILLFNGTAWTCVSSTSLDKYHTLLANVTTPGSGTGITTNKIDLTSVNGAPPLTVTLNDLDNQTLTYNPTTKMLDISGPNGSGVISSIDLKDLGIASATISTSPVTSGSTTRTVTLTRNDGTMMTFVVPDNDTLYSADGSTVELLAGNIFQVKDLGITTAKLADLSVTTAKLADQSVTTSKLAACTAANQVLMYDGSAWNCVLATSLDKYHTAVSNTQTQGSGTGFTTNLVNLTSSNGAPALSVLINDQDNQTLTYNPLNDNLVISGPNGNGVVSTIDLSELGIASVGITVSPTTSGSTTRTLTLTRDDGSTMSVIIPDNDTLYTVDNATLEMIGNQIAIKDGGVTTAKIATDAITYDKIADCSGADNILLYNGTDWVCALASSIDKYHTAIANTNTQAVSGTGTITNKLDISSSNGAPLLTTTLTDYDNQVLSFDTMTKVISLSGPNGVGTISSVTLPLDIKLASASISSAASSGSVTRTLTLTLNDGNTVTVVLPDNDTLYTAGVGLSLVGTTFNNTGVLSLVSGDGVILVDNTDAQNPKVSLSVCGASELYVSNGTTWSCIASTSLYSFNIQDAGTGISNITNGENVTFKATDGLTAVVSPTGDVSYGILDNAVLGTKIADASLPKEKLAACSGAGEILLFNGTAWTCVSSTSLDKYHTLLANVTTPGSGTGITTNKIDLTSVNGAPPLTVTLNDLDNQTLTYNPTTKMLDISGPNGSGVISSIDLKDLGIASATISTSAVTSGSTTRTVTLTRNDGTMMTFVVPDNDTLYSADGSTIELLAGNIFQVKDLGITTAKLADLSVTTAKLADQSVTTSKLAACTAANQVLMYDGSAWNCVLATSLDKYHTAVSNTQTQGSGTGFTTNLVNLTSSNGAPALSVLINDQDNQTLTYNPLNDNLVISGPNGNGVVSTIDLSELGIASVGITVSPTTSGSTTRTLTLTRDDGSTMSVIIPDNDTLYTVDNATLEMIGNQIAIKDGGVTTAKIATDAITYDKIADCSGADNILLYNGTDWVCALASSIDKYHTAIANTNTQAVSGTGTITNKLDISSSNGAPLLTTTLTDYDNQVLSFDTMTKVISLSGPNGVGTISSVTLPLDIKLASASISSAASSGSVTRTLTLTLNDGNTVTVVLPDNDTLYTAGVGLSLVGTTFNNTGVLSLASGDGVILVDNTDAQNPKVSLSVCGASELYVSNGTTWSCIASTSLYSFNIQDAGTGISNITNGENVTFKATDGLTAVVSPTGDVSYGILDNSVLGTKIADASLPKEKLAACSGAGEILLFNGTAWTCVSSTSLDKYHTLLANVTTPGSGTGITTNKIDLTSVNGAPPLTVTLNDLDNQTLTYNPTTKMLDISGPNGSGVISSIDLKDLGIASATISTSPVTSGSTTRTVTLTRNDGTMMTFVVPDNDTLYSADGSTVELLAGNIFQVKDLGITTAKLVDLSVTTAKLADQSVTTSKLAACTAANQVLMYDGSAWNCVLATSLDKYHTAVSNTQTQGSGTGFTTNLVNLTSSNGAPALSVLINDQDNQTLTYNPLNDNLVISGPNGNGVVSTIDLSELGIASVGITVSPTTSGSTTRTLTLTRDDGSTMSVIIPDNDTLYTVDNATLEMIGNQIAIKDGGVTTAKIATDAITYDKIADCSGADNILLYNGTDWVCALASSIDKYHTAIANTNTQAVSGTGTITNKLDITSSNGAPLLTTTLTDYDNQVLSFDTMTKVISLSGPNGVGTISSVTLPLDIKLASASISSAASSGSVTRTLTLTLNDGNTVTVVLPDNDTLYTASNGLSLVGNAFSVNSPTCGATQKLLWNGSAFVCATDSDVQTLTFTALTNTLAISGGNSVVLPYLQTEVDGIIGNEITNVGTSTALVRSGSGTALSPYIVDLKSCANNEVLRYNTGTSTWTCSATTAGTVTSIATGNGLTGGPITTTGTVSVNAPTCLATERLSWNGTAFVCVANGAEVDGVIGNEVVDVTVGTGLTRTGTVAAGYNIALNVPVASCATGERLTWSTAGSGSFICSSVAFTITDNDASTAGTVTQTINPTDQITYAKGARNALEATVLGTDTVSYDLKACANNEILKYATGTSTWNCSADADTTYTASNGLSLVGNAFSVNSPTCSAGQKLLWNGTAFVCATDSDVQTLTFTALTNTLAISGGNSVVLPYLQTEVDGIIGNEITNVGASTALVRSGSGTALSPYIVDLKSCANNEVLRYNTGTSTWTCSATTAGTVTSIATGNGLTGGPITTTGTVSVNAPTCLATERLSWNGTAFVCVANGAEVDGVIGNEVVDVTVGTGLTRTGTVAAGYNIALNVPAVSCATGERLSWSTAGSGSFICSSVAFTITDNDASTAGTVTQTINPTDQVTYSKGARAALEVTVLGTDTVSYDLKACANNEILKYATGTSTWNCSSDADTTYLAGAGLTLIGNTFSIGTDQITSSMILDGTVTTTDILNGTISLVDMANNSVNSAIIVDGSITTADILDGTVGLVDLAANSVDSSKIVDGSVTSTDILDGTILLTDMAANSVDSSKIVNGTILPVDLANCTSNAQILKYYTADPDGAGPLVAGWNCDSDLGAITVADGTSAAATIFSTSNVTNINAQNGLDWVQTATGQGAFELGNNPLIHNTNIPLNSLNLTMSDGNANDALGLVGVNTTTPLSNFDVDGSLGTRIVNVGGNYTPTFNDHTIIAQAGVSTITLPNPSTAQRREYVIRNAGTGSILITGNIDTNPAASKGLLPEGEMTLQSDGSTWRVVNDDGSTKVMVIAQKSTAQTLTATSTAIPYNIASYNLLGAYNTATGVFTAPYTGFYQITSSARYVFAVNNGAPNIACMDILGPGGTVQNSSCNSSENDCCTAGTDIKSTQVTATIFLTAGQTAQVNVYTPSGVAPTLQTVSGTNMLQIVRVE